MKEIVVNLEAIVLLSFYQIDLRLPGSHSFPISQRSSPYRGNDHKAYSPEPAYQHLREQSLHARSHIGRIGLVEALDLTDSPLQSDVCVREGFHLNVSPRSIENVHNFWHVYPNYT